MASTQCYQTVEKTCNQVSCPPVTNQGQTQYCAQSQCQTGHQNPTAKPCMDQNKGHGHGSGSGLLGMVQTYTGMGATHASHGSNHCMDQNKTHGHKHSHSLGHEHEHGHGMTLSHSSNGHGQGLVTHTHSSNGHGRGSSMTHCTSQNCGPNNGTASHGRTQKKSLLQRIKDGISGDSSDSSDSESDNECCGKTRTMKKC